MRLLATLVVCVLPMVVGCAAPFPDRNAAISAAWLESSTREAEPARRTLETVRPLTENEVALLSALMTTYERRSLGYVSPAWYIRYETPAGIRRIGLYTLSNGQLRGFDYTPPDPAKAHITAPHDLLFPTDTTALTEFGESVLGR